MNHFWKIAALFLVLMFSACQSEDASQTVNQDASIARTSPLASLIARVVQNPTYWDNLIDDSNCYSVKFPFGITVNGQHFSIGSESDFQAVAANMGNDDSDADIVHFDFPITLIFRDFQQQLVTSQSQLNNISCNSSDFHEIRCVDFAYPLTVDVYNTANQSADSFVVASDSDFFALIDGAGSGDLFTIAYPLTLTFSSGQQVTVSNNDELENAIEDSIDDCDVIGPGQPPQSLMAVITDGTWRISYCEGPVGPNGYDGYNFTFLPDGSVTVVKNSVTGSGSWTIYTDGSHEMMTLSFSDTYLVGLQNDQWKVTEYNAMTFRLKDDNSGSGNRNGQGNRSGSDDGQNDYVYFSKN